MFKTLELPGVFALDPLGALSGPKTPRLIILHPPPFLIPGFGPADGVCMGKGIFASQVSDSLALI